MKSNQPNGGKEMKDLVEIIIEAAKKAATLHMLTNDKFSKLEKHQDRAVLLNGELYKILCQELPSFIRVHLEDTLAETPEIGEDWLRKFVNTQCNLWGISAATKAQSKI